MADENLPVLEPLPAGPEQVDFNAIIEIAEMNGVNDAMDALVGQGISAAQAGQMLESAGFALPGLAQPENVPAAMQPEGGPPQVRRAEPVIKPTGAVMDVGFIEQLNSAGSQEEFNAMYDKLPKVQQHIYDRSFAQDIDPAWASQKAEEFYKMQDERTKVAEDPMKQAQLEERRAKLQERKVVQTDFKIRRDNTIKNIEEVLNDGDYASLVGPIDGTAGALYDATFDQKKQAKRAKLSRLINFDVLDMTKYLRPVSQDELKYLRTLVPGQTQHWEVYKQYLGEKLEMLKATDRAAFNPATSLPLAADDAPATAQPAAATPSAAQGRNTFTTPDGYTYRRMPDGSAELVE